MTPRHGQQAAARAAAMARQHRARLSEVFTSSPLQPGAEATLLLASTFLSITSRRLTATCSTAAGHPHWHANKHLLPTKVQSRKVPLQEASCSGTSPDMVSPGGAADLSGRGAPTARAAGALGGRWLASGRSGPRRFRGLKRSLTRKLFCGLTRKLLPFGEIPQATTTRGQARPFACAAQVDCGLVRLLWPRSHCNFTCTRPTHPCSHSRRGRGGTSALAC